METTMQAVCVYCGSAFGVRDDYRQGATALGQALAAGGITLIYGGGRVGLMGRVADATLEAGGRAVGVIPQLLMDKEVAHTGLTELHVVKDMHERKRMMADLSDGFITLPGGAGTLEELFEIYTWAQLGYHNKPIGLLNVAHFYDPLLAMLRHTAAEGFIQSAFLDLFLTESDARLLLQRLQTYQPVVIDKWKDGRNAV